MPHKRRTAQSDPRAPEFCAPASFPLPTATQKSSKGFQQQNPIADKWPPPEITVCDPFPALHQKQRLRHRYAEGKEGKSVTEIIPCGTPQQDRHRANKHERANKPPAGCFIGKAPDQNFTGIFCPVNRKNQLQSFTFATEQNDRLQKAQYDAGQYAASHQNLPF